MTKIILYIATSKDNYIADENGSVDWLPQTLSETGGQDYGYHEFYDSVDAIAIGRKTYEQILGFGDWPYPGKLSYIFTRKSMESSNKDVEFVSDDIPGFIRGLESQKIKKLWMVGGPELIDAFYTKGRIDEFIVTVFPNVLKKGIALQTLSDALERDELVKLHSIDFGSGVFQDYYMIKN
ncbi:MAG: dihydrofolate reductase family protein [Chlamydiales bacterium]